jgi:voltage-gated sodium channel
LVHSNVFDKFIILIVVLNTVALMSKSYQMNVYFEDLLKFLNYVFAFIFNVEMILKLSSDGHRYFLDNWNLFDMFIVITADIGIILEMYSVPDNFKSVTTVFRALRILRIAKLLKEFKNIRVILDSVAVILPNISHVMCLFVLILYIYACIGIYMFAGAKRIAELNEYNNFTTFGRAMLGLTRYSTGEDF